MDIMPLAQKQRLKQEREVQEHEQEQQQEKKPYLIHRFQPIHGSQSLVIVLPKKYTTELGINKGDYAKFWISDGKLILEKVQD